jgi:hypothetical protein
MGEKRGDMMDSKFSKINHDGIDWEATKNDWEEWFELNSVPNFNEFPASEIDFKEDSEYKRMYGSDSNFKYNYSELSTLTEIKEYIESTYSEHYTNQNNEVQTLDVWKARGSMTDSCIDTTIKYLMRYGRKDGKNKKDLLKAIHYLVLALGNERG